MTSVKIKKQDIEDIFPLLPMQEAMLAVYVNDHSAEENCEQILIEITGHIDKKIFGQAWKFVVNSNQMLRTTYRWKGLKKIVQIVLKEHSPEIRYLEVSGKNEAIIADILYRDRQDKFDLEKVPFRITLIKENQRYILVISNHHIIMDGWSTSLVINEFLNAYNYIACGNIPEKTAKLSIKGWFKNYSVEKSGFWDNYLRGLTLGYKLFPKGINHAKSGYTTKAVRISEWNNEIAKASRQAKVSPASYYYAAWALCLQKHFNSFDVLFYVTHSLREKEWENTVGLFINTLPIRVKTEGYSPLQEVVKLVYNDLVNQIPYRTEMPESQPLYGDFNSLLVFNNYPVNLHREEDTNIYIQNIEYTEKTNNGITLIISDLNEPELKVIYKNELFSDPEIDYLLNEYLEILIGLDGTQKEEILTLEYEDIILPPVIKNIIPKDLCYKLVNKFGSGNQYCRNYALYIEDNKCFHDTGFSVYLNQMNELQLIGYGNRIYIDGVFIDL
ncbi:MAG: condensation domain-containing protein [Rikenellaceae bacterium]|nr:condensation domain-containing protein [Rikenellaceae bacterium]